MKEILSTKTTHARHNQNKPNNFYFKSERHQPCADSIFNKYSNSHIVTKCNLKLGTVC